MFTTKLILICLDISLVEELGFFPELPVVEDCNRAECKDYSDDLCFGVDSTSSRNLSFSDDSVSDHVQRYAEDFGCSGNAKSAKTNLCRASDFHGVVQKRSGALGYILGEKCADDLYCGRHRECAADLGLDCDRSHNSASDVGLGCDCDHDHDCADDLDCARDWTSDDDVSCGHDQQSLDGVDRCSGRRHANGLDCGRNEAYSRDVTYVAKLRRSERLGFACVRGCAEISQCSGALDCTEVSR
ncbi:hypothetical protein GN958_ATG09286 [Phytophthora infestans]|uniref:Uncharacterized protein n=1 Tax=Phytophthora infestans TaxID=4787 RepID=A0A8S9UR43_PHYIN|nr:hypothetical protein GN958_ATG09286 [Phytophthora infestans]